MEDWAGFIQVSRFVHYASGDFTPTLSTADLTESYLIGDERDALVSFPHLVSAGRLQFGRVENGQVVTDATGYDEGWLKLGWFTNWRMSPAITGGGVGFAAVRDLASAESTTRRRSPRARCLHLWLVSSRPVAAPDGLRGFTI